MENIKIKYATYDVVFREFPDEMTLAINISGCPNHCKNCHSAYLANDIGEELTEEVLNKLISENKGITCVGFMGGDQCPSKVVKLSQYIKSKYPNLHTGWYSGREIFPANHGTFDYIKLGPYIEENGPLPSRTTNQRMYMNVSNKKDDFCATFVDITEQAFWSKKPWEADYYDDVEDETK